MQRPCAFCEVLEWDAKMDSKMDAEWENEYTVALVSHSILYNEDGTWMRRGRTTDYRYKGLGYKLKYCPECGRKLHLKRPRKRKVVDEKEA